MRDYVIVTDSCCDFSAQMVGEGVCPHWWAVLEPREEEAL